jgi:hypothetical protein
MTKLFASAPPSLAFTLIDALDFSLRGGGSAKALQDKMIHIHKHRARVGQIA